MQRINSATTESQLVDIMVNILQIAGFLDNRELLDVLENVGSPLVNYSQQGDRSLSRAVIRKMKATVKVEYRREDNCWYPV